MNVSYSWLKKYINVNKTAQEVADDLTSIGLEVDGVEEVETIKGGLKGLVVGEVLTCEAHPDSDHLHVTTVNVGEGEPLQIVCGAPNVAAGQKVVVATIGTVLYDGDKSFTAMYMTDIHISGDKFTENSIRDTAGKFNNTVEAGLSKAIANGKTVESNTRVF